MTAWNPARHRSLAKELAAATADGRFVSLLLSAPTSREERRPRRIKLHPVTIRGRKQLQAAQQIGTQEVHQNLDMADGIAATEAWFGNDFRQARLLTTDAEFNYSVTGSGAIKCRRKEVARPPAPQTHDRSKAYLIPEGEPCPFLEAIGVMTAGGAVRRSQHRKFRQINRYLEFIRDVLPALPPEGLLSIVDHGCGKSSLTFALHHYLTNVLRREVRIVGLDLKQDVIADCSDLAERLGLTGLTFLHADVAAFQPDHEVHMAVSLHACDTATDAALANAVRWGSQVILAVPCCQHELAPQLSVSGLEPMLAHGILKERFAAMATDALRAAALETQGYQTDVIEFIDMEHTPKNVLIRALRKPPGDLQPAQDRYRRLWESFGSPEFTLTRLLKTPLDGT